MAFPSSPIDGQTVVVNSTTYYYQASANAWRRKIAGGAINLAAMTVGNLTVGTGNPISTTESYDLDDVSNYTDGRTNSFKLTYNTSPVSVVSPWNLDVYVNGVKQPAFTYNGDVNWQSFVLSANKGFCIDYTGNIRFADAPPARSQVTITTKIGANSQSRKRYPFNPGDIVLGN